jgi:uncharacterized repeat protein (TIGR03803 family)
MNADGSGFTTLYSFSGGRDGAFPAGRLTISGNTLYGACSQDGPNGNGAIFSINTDGSNFKVIYGFPGSVDGTVPTGSLLLSGTTLYGQNSSGGTFGFGTVFKLDTSGTNYTVLYAFSDSGDGNWPAGGLVQSGNTLFGVTTMGGTNGTGAIFSLNIDGTNFQNLYSFAATPDGTLPEGGLIISGSTLYGMTRQGGAAGWGSVFKINTDGTAYSILHSFAASADGKDPHLGSLVLSGTTLYGLTSGGGTGGAGTIFSLNTDGSNYSTIYSFVGGSGGTGPYGGLIISDSVLYGTTCFGGNSVYGTIFGFGL